MLYMRFYTKQSNAKTPRLEALPHFCFSYFFNMNLFRRHISLVHALGLLGNRHPEEPLVYKRLDDCGHGVVPGFLCEGDEVGAGLRGCAVPDDRLGDLGVRGLSRVGRVGCLVADAVVERDLKHAVRDAENGGR